MIRKYMDASTAHLSKAAKVWLKGMADKNYDTNNPEGMGAHHVAGYTFGWWVHVPTKDCGFANGFPDDLKQICVFAQDNDCDFIDFDADAELIDGIEVFE